MLFPLSPAKPLDYDTQFWSPHIAGYLNQRLGAMSRRYRLVFRRNNRAAEAA